MKIFNKISLFLFWLSSLLYASLAQAAFLNTKTSGGIKENARKFAEDGAGYEGNVSIGGVVAIVIQILLSILGVIFVSMIVYSGFLWMMARGNEEQARKAKDIIRHALVGLIITLTAYSITYFIVRVLALSIGGGQNDVDIGIPVGS